MEAKSIVIVLCLLVTVTNYVNAIGAFLPSFRCKYMHPEQPTVELKTISQKLDHFDRLNSAKWQQRYYANEQFFRPGGPLFVMLGGPHYLTPYRMTISLMADMAEELHGGIYFLEHRFYGESKPTEDTRIENLKFLTVEQALYDTEAFIANITNDRENSKVVVIGGYYGGSLAVWFRQKFPHLVTGAWASSAPLQGQVSTQFNELAGAAYKTVAGDKCFKAIEEGFDVLEEYLSEGKKNLVEETFSTCDPITTDADISIFKQLISEIFTVIPQLNHLHSIQSVCDMITEGYAKSPIDRIARHVAVSYEKYFGASCVPSSYEKIVNLLRQTNWSSPVNELAFRPWAYQLCDHLGWFHTSNSKSQPFAKSDDSSLWFNVCADVFGEEFTKEAIVSSVKRFNRVFGAKEPGVTRTIFVHGDIDPWRTFGIQTKPDDPSSHVITIAGASQINELFSLNQGNDSPQLHAAKRTIINIITEWLKNE